MASHPPRRLNGSAKPHHGSDENGSADERAGLPKQSSLQDYSRREPKGEDRTVLAGDIGNVNDRAAGIILGSDVEWYLEQLLLAYLPNAGPGIFLQPNGPLTDFYAKNQLAFAMGIIPEGLLKDLEVVRSVRNGFAHARAPMRFQTLRLRMNAGR